VVAGLAFFAEAAAAGVVASFFLFSVLASVSVSAAALLVRAFLFARVKGVSTKRRWAGSSTRPMSISSLDQFQSQSLPSAGGGAAEGEEEQSSSESSSSALRSEVDQPSRGLLALAVANTIPVWRWRMEDVAARRRTAAPLLAETSCPRSSARTLRV
jgi:hypothetical protein